MIDALVFFGAPLLVILGILIGDFHATSKGGE